MIGCLGIVLAGGLSSRMGKDKAFLERRNQPMVEFSKQLLLEAGVENVVVSGNTHDIADIYEQQGPVGGIYSVLTQTNCQAALILPVDLPLMTANVLAELKHLGSLSQKATYFSGHSLPLYLPINSYTELFFNRCFSQPGNKGPSVRQLLSSVPHQEVACKTDSALFNTNTPQQWQQALEHMNNQRGLTHGESVAR
ncbi:molybdenum cofactor guanylyltransferase [Thalassotalea euphylliae]|uniref:molybdenum cofactor guanylyltransferase n=1 Tax=Thalassotalea euphylliae TaxID=1655234 RepID=UPI003634D21A